MRGGCPAREKGSFLLMRRKGGAGEKTKRGSVVEEAGEHRINAKRSKAFFLVPIDCNEKACQFERVGS
jgi:hypothetical protein